MFIRRTRKSLTIALTIFRILIIFFILFQFFFNPFLDKLYYDNQKEHQFKTFIYNSTTALSYYDNYIINEVEDDYELFSKFLWYSAISLANYAAEYNNIIITDSVFLCILSSKISEDLSVKPLYVNELCEYLRLIITTYFNTRESDIDTALFRNFQTIYFNIK